MQFHGASSSLHQATPRNTSKQPPDIDALRGIAVVGQTDPRFAYRPAAHPQTIERFLLCDPECGFNGKVPFYSPT